MFIRWYHDWVSVWGLEVTGGLVEEEVMLGNYLHPEEWRPGGGGSGGTLVIMKSRRSCSSRCSWSGVVRKPGRIVWTCYSAAVLQLLFDRYPKLFLFRSFTDLFFCF